MRWGFRIRQPQGTVFASRVARKFGIPPGNLEDKASICPHHSTPTRLNGKPSVTKTHQIVSGGLLRLLADTLVLLYKTRHLSWRANESICNGLRAVVWQDHRELDAAVDRIAHRIRALGREVPPNYSDLIRSSSIKQELELREEIVMTGRIREDHMQIMTDIETLEVTLPLDQDAATRNLLNDLYESHRKCRDKLNGLLRSHDQILL